MGQSFQLKAMTSWTGSRRTFGTGALAAIGASTLGTGVALGQATPAASPVTEGDGRFLIVGDRTQTTMYAYSIPDFGLAATIEDVEFGTHGGVVVLPDGSMVFADTKNDRILSLAIGVDGLPVIDREVAATFNGGIAWVAASHDFSHVAIGSLQDSETTQFLNIVDLATFENTALEFELNEPEEVTAWLLNDPLNVYVAVGGQIKSYLLSDLLAGNLEPLNVVEVELGSHGGATDVANSRIFYTTAPGTGFEVLDVQNGAAEYLAQVPWDVDGLTGGRNARPRVTADGEHIFGLMTPGIDDPTTWAETMISIHVTEMTELTAVRNDVATGNYAYRWGLSDRFALWAGYNAEGGTVYLIDADARSSTFGTVSATMSVDVPTNAAIAGQDFTGKDTYATAITADSRYGFVSINGDRVVKVFDLEAQEEIAEIEIELPLSGYDGYLAILETGASTADVWGR